jgi:hypothetical protein
MLLLIALGVAPPVRAQDVGYSSLTIYNRGTIPFNVVVAMDNEPLIGGASMAGTSLNRKTARP